MYFYYPVAIAALFGVAQAINLFPTTITCSKLSSDCATACGPGYQPCGNDQCYSPSKGELCCSSTPCPFGAFCSTEGKGCVVPTSPAPGDNWTTASDSTGSYGTWSVSGTSTAVSLSSFANATIITSASAASNFSFITKSTITSAQTNNASDTGSSPTSTSSGASGIDTSSNLTYSTNGPTTTSVVAPAKTGTASLFNVATGLGMVAIWAQLMVGCLWHESSLFDLP